MTRSHSLAHTCLAMMTPSPASISHPRFEHDIIRHFDTTPVPPSPIPIFRVRESLMILSLSSGRIAFILRVPDGRPDQPARRHAGMQSGSQAVGPIIHLAPFSTCACHHHRLLLLLLLLLLAIPSYSGAAEPKPPMIVARLCDASFLRSIARRGRI